jgi:hypothetical protein
MKSPCILFPALALGLALVLTGCGDDGSTGDSTAGMGSTGTTTMSSGSSDGSTGETATSAVTGSMDSTGPGTTSAATTGDMTSDTGVDTDSLECFGLDARACMANGLCMPIVGAPILMPDGGACLGPREFLECQPAIGCGDAITYACAGLDAPQYQFLDTCIPEAWIDCGEPPAGELPPC